MARTSRRERERRTSDAEQGLLAVYAESTATPTELIAIDPGDEHIGVAFFGRTDDGQWYCQDVQQIDGPDEFEDALLETLLTTPVPLTVVYEKFRLYEDKAKLQKGSEFRTAQMIGVIKFIVRQRHHHFATGQLQLGAVADEYQSQQCGGQYPGNRAERRSEQQ